MNKISADILQKANEEAIYNVYLYLLHKRLPKENESLNSIVLGLESASKNKMFHNWKDRDIYRLNILKNAVLRNKTLADSQIINLTYSKSGLTACSFKKPNGNISVVFKGTGSGEWIDSGEGLSGIPEANTYIIYEKGGKAVHSQIVQNDYATDQQVDALNWFNSIAYKNNWNVHTKITVSGHSKGGNKAQFVAVNSNLADDCYSFDGQGFSPEALFNLKKQYGKKYEERRWNIRSFSAENDYVNVLGERLVPEQHIYYFESRTGIHNIEAILDENGNFRPQTEQGKLSLYVETFSEELMQMPPAVRQYATLGIMNIFQKYLGEGIPVNGDSVSMEKTIAGVGLAISSLLNRFRKN